MRPEVIQPGAVVRLRRLGVDEAVLDGSGENFSIFLGKNRKISALTLPIQYGQSPYMTIQRLRKMVKLAVPALFKQIQGGRVRCESESTLQLHLGRIIATVADLSLIHSRETFSIELEKPLSDFGKGRGRLDIWFRITDDEPREWRCALELKLFKKANQREPNNRYDVFKDIDRLERCHDVADLGFMLVATDHAHYITQPSYSSDTGEFDFRHDKSYLAGSPLTYKTGNYGKPITLKHDYKFIWSDEATTLRYLLLEVEPVAEEV